MPVLFHSEGNVEFYFDDSDIFWEHVYIVIVTQAMELGDTSVAG